ncbi:DNA alkylation repair protein [Patescibacteria group bacterium]
MLTDIEKEINSYKNAGQATALQRFFKTAKGEYGEGDIFLGIKVPIQRKIVARYWKYINLDDTKDLLNSKIHEYRLIALLILVRKYSKGDTAEKQKIYKIYLNNRKYINNWDLVDLSAPNIVGEYLLRNDRKVLYKLAKSKSLWDRRIAILSTFALIRNNDFTDSLKISKILLNDSHDLIHKAVGWMLREIGKRDQKLEESFLIKYYKTMPRTMLRYAIEKFSEKKRMYYMSK